MRSIQVNVYNINELSEKAKQKAYLSWCSTIDYPWSNENENTLYAFENIFPIKVTHWEYDEARGYIKFRFTDDDTIANLSGIRLMKYLYNNYFNHLYKGRYYSLWRKKENSTGHKCPPKLISRYSKIILDNCCPLTGYCVDDAILEPIYEFLKRPYDITFEGLMKKCLDSWITACVEDYAYCYSMEYFIEEALVNDYEYFKDGSRALSYRIAE